jgi:cysteine desulfurase
VPHAECMLRRIYLDYAAAAPASSAALAAFKRAQVTFGNPSSPHAEGQAAKEVLETARITIARLAGVKADAIIFTSGATEANNLALQGAVRHAQAAGKRPHVLYLPTQHASIMETIVALAERGVDTEALIVRDGRIDTDVLKTQLARETVLVTMDAVCSETGVRWNTRDVKRVLAETRFENTKQGSQALLHVDASQLPLVESIEMTRLAADLMTLDASKVGGVRGIGVLIARDATSLQPIQFGGGQERGLRPGTEATSLAAAFAVALADADKSRVVFAASAQMLRSRAVDVIRTLPDAYIQEWKEMAPHILNVSFLGRDTDYLVALLDAAGIAASTKSACETDAAGSRAVRVLTNDDARAQSTLRISLGPDTRTRDITRLGTELVRAVTFLGTHPL